MATQEMVMRHLGEAIYQHLDCSIDVHLHSNEIICGMGSDALWYLRWIVLDQNESEDEFTVELMANGDIEMSLIMKNDNSYEDMIVGPLADPLIAAKIVASQDTLRRSLRGEDEAY